MTVQSYISQEALREIDALRKKINEQRSEHIIKLHNQRRTALEKEALNTSFFIEYPESQYAPGTHKDRETRKLVRRLEGAWRYCLDTIRSTDEITTRELEIIQAIILPEGRLGIRTEEVTFNVPHEIPAPTSKLVPKYLEELFTEVKGLKEKLHPVELAAYYHLHLLYIHPFMDGNGRTTRTVQNFLLSTSGYVPAVIEPHERWLYFSLLDTAKKGIIDSETPSQRPFYEFMATKVHEGLEKVLED